jgi:hypothetical protein
VTDGAERVAHAFQRLIDVGGANVEMRDRTELMRASRPVSTTHTAPASTTGSRMAKIESPSSARVAAKMPIDSGGWST